MASLLKKLITIRKTTLPKDIQLRFLRRLSRLLSNGYPLIEALEIIKWDDQMMGTAAQMITLLKNGNTIDQAFEKTDFHHTVTSYLYFVRANGDLQTSIDKCVEMYEHRLNYMKKFQQIARYPLILLIIFSVLLYFIKKLVLPSFVDLFQSSSEASSTVTLSIMIIEFLGTFVLVTSILLLFSALLWQINKRKIKIDQQIKFYNSIPIYRKFLKLQTSFLFATHLSTLLKTGMSIKEILHHMAKQKKLPIIAYYSHLMIEELSKGFPLASLLSQFTFFEQHIATIFQKNADMNALEKDLTMYAEFATDELHQKIMKTITFIQPFFFIVLASFIIFIYVTLMWPMFQLIKTI